MNRMSGKRIGHPHRTALLMSKLMMALLIAAALAGCGNGKAEERPPGQADGQPSPSSQKTDSGVVVDEARQGDFVYRLIVEPPPAAEAGSKPKLSAELEYVGDQDEVTIYHSASPFYFFVKETTRDYSLAYMMNEPLITTKLKRGEPMSETYRGSGGYSKSKDSQDYIDFVDELAKSGFPPGQYETTGRADFYTEVDGNKHDYIIEANVTFAVDQ